MTEIEITKDHSAEMGIVGDAASRASHGGEEGNHTHYQYEDARRNWEHQENVDGPVRVKQPECQQDAVDCP